MPNLKSPQSRTRLPLQAAVLLLLLLPLPPVAAQPLDFTIYSKDQGLAAQSSFSAVQDDLGFMWFGTNNGLQRFDGETFIHYPPSDDSLGLPDGQIWALHDDGRYLWLGTQAGGLVKFDPQKEVFTPYMYPEGSGLGNGPEWITDIEEDENGVLWLATRRHGLNKFDPKTEEWSVYVIELADGDPMTQVGAMMFDDDGNFWVGAGNGLYVFDREIEQFSARPFWEGRRPSIANLYMAEDGTVWCGTFAEGLISYHPETGKVEHFYPDGEGKFKYPGGTVFKIRGAGEGKLWLATWGMGLCRFDPVSGHVEVLSEDEENEYAISSNYVFGIYLSGDDVMWLTTDSYLCKASLRQLKMTRVMYPEDLSRLSMDIDGSLYATNGSMYRYDTGKWEKLTTIYDRPENRVSDAPTCHNNAGHWTPQFGMQVTFVDRKTNSSRVYTVDNYVAPEKGEHVGQTFVDANDNVWICTEYGLYIFSELEQKFVAGLPENIRNQFRDYSVRAFEIDANGDYWIATREGLYFWNRKTDELQGFFKGTGKSAFRDDNLKDMVIGPKGQLWIGTVGSGIERLDPETGTITQISWPDDFILTDVKYLMFDSKDRLWISHFGGLIMYDPASDKSVFLDRTDGLTAQMSYAIYELPDGNIAVGNARGCTIIDPEDIYINRTVPKSSITGFSMYNDPVDYRTEEAPINRNMSYVEQLDLSYSDKVWAFDFMPLHFDDPQENTVQFMLEGFDREWVDARGKRSMTYTNLNPGDYTFKVRSANSDGVFQSDYASVSVYVAPPWWQTWWAISLFIIAGIAVALGIRRYELRRIRLANALEMEKLEADRLKELDQIKSDFFANISHEFRTPLTVIMGQIDDAIELTSNNVSKGLTAAYSNAKKLLSLVNQILDLSKIEAGALELHPQEEDIIPFLKTQLFAFESLAAKNGIKLEYNSDIGSAIASYENAKLEKVFANLISNAVKFTGNPGYVRMEVASPDDKTLEISISDNGIGIPPEQLNRIFERFHQVDGSSSRGYEGTGIGLTLVNELVRLHNGTITVESEEGVGSSFKVTLPVLTVLKSSTAAPVPAPAPEKKTAPLPDLATISNNGNTENPILLIVEDNHDVRAYIRQCMEDKYTVYEAKDGIEGLEQAAEHVPDLIISDIMMPRMDGFDFSAKIRSDAKTSHVPLIMLTAQAADESKLKGLSLGIDDYLTKPFQRKELVARAANLIELRKKLQSHYANYSAISPSEIKVTSVDDKFVKQVLTFIDDNLSDPMIGVEQIAESVNMSTSQLGRKTKALLDITPGQLLRKLRLKRAADLITQGAGTVSEICFQSGFSDVTSFTRSFKREYGVAPSQFADSPPGPPA